MGTNVETTVHSQALIRVEDLAGLFSVLHDGTIDDATADGADLFLLVKIGYLAARIRPDLTTFGIRLCDVQDLTFATWPNDPMAGPDILRISPNAVSSEPARSSRVDWRLRAISRLQERTTAAVH